LRACRTVGAWLPGRDDRLRIQVASELVGDVEVDVPDLSIDRPVQILGKLDGVEGSYDRESENDPSHGDDLVKHPKSLPKSKEKDEGEIKLCNSDMKTPKSIKAACWN